MTTTIQIDDDTKKILFKIKLKLESKKESAITYNELIRYLLKNQKKTLLEKKSLKEFRKFEGMLSESAVEEYWLNKRKELKREEQQAPMNKKNL